MFFGVCGYEIWICDFIGGCGLFSFVFRSGDVVVWVCFVDVLLLFGIGYSWGGFESLVVLVDFVLICVVSFWLLFGMD